MRSKASFRGHPSHPALIPFPLAFMTGAFVFDLAGSLLNARALWVTGAHLALAGVLTGVLAAIPGLIDFVYTVPPNSSGKKRAIRHMLSMVSAMALFAFARWLRGDAANPPDTIILGMEGLGAIALMFGGWLGGTLVSRNQVSVDHRYANAGKWQEERVDSPKGEDPITVGTGDLEVNQMRLLRVGDKRIVVGRTADGYVAFDDHCTHRGGSLAGGVMICGTVQCPWHGSQFDVATGNVKAGPAKKSISTYRVEAGGGKLRVFGLPRG
ncbi:MAG: Rieske 2Fe-2S domain-containing protein [Gemmatimonadota bacterium]|nr:Rieske 2Fe-2S domain-containing protein [Gemmatimonadota bacterium]